MQQSDDPTVQDADVVEDTQQQASEPPTDPQVQEQAPSQAEELLNIESLIKNNLSQASKAKEELAEQRGMLNDSLNNDVNYKEHLDKAKEANKLKNAIKAEILKRPELADTSNKVKSLTSQIKENQEAISYYLQEFQKLSGATEIEDADGEVRQIVYVAKLVKKSRDY